MERLESRKAQRTYLVDYERGLGRISHIEFEHSFSIRRLEMIQSLKKIVQKFLALDERLTRTFDGSFYQMATLKQWLIIIIPFGSFWVFASFAHVIGPWLDALLNIGPHDIDSPGKVLWRRIWSSLLCGPVIGYATVRFAVNRYKFHQQSKKLKKVM
jgi:hypothetical protein